MARIRRASDRRPGFPNLASTAGVERQTAIRAFHVTVPGTGEVGLRRSSAAAGCSGRTATVEGRRPRNQIATVPQGEGFRGDEVGVAREIGKDRFRSGQRPFARGGVAAQGRRRTHACRARSPQMASRPAACRASPEADWDWLGQIYRTLRALLRGERSIGNSAEARALSRRPSTGSHAWRVCRWPRSRRRRSIPSSNSVWVSEVGTQLEIGALGRRIVDHTRSEFGRVAPSHRTCFATAPRR